MSPFDLCEGCSPTPVRWHLDLETLARHRRRLTCRRLRTHPSPDGQSGWEVTHSAVFTGPGG